MENVLSGIWRFHKRHFAGKTNNKVAWNKGKYCICLFRGMDSFLNEAFHIVLWDMRTLISRRMFWEEGPMDQGLILDFETFRTGRMCLIEGEDLTAKIENVSTSSKTSVSPQWRCASQILCWTRKEKERWQSDVENINVWNGHYYFIQMPFLCLKNLSANGSANAAHVKRKPRDRRRFKWEQRAYAKTTCVAAISKQRRCGELGRSGTFLGSRAALRSSYCSSSPVDAEDSLRRGNVKHGRKSQS